MKTIKLQKAPLKKSRRMSKKFAAFDIDGTLIRWQLFHAIVHQLGKDGHIGAKQHDAIRDARMKWKNRGSPDSFANYEKILVETYMKSLQGIQPADYLIVVDEVFEEYKDQLFVFTRSLLQSLKHKGYILFAISGSQDEIVQKLAAYHGFDAAIGSKLVIHEGRYTGEIETPIVNKAAVLETLVKQHSADYADSIAVGDSKSDIAMLKAVQHPIAFNPEQTLFQYAKEQGWRIAVERKNVVYDLAPSDNGYNLN
jgi:HAD superfamily hydrolase (TIGR01490 family)